jgi:hypothetical protein
MLRANFAYDVRHVARVHHANVARTCRARDVLDPTIDIRYYTLKTEVQKVLLLARKCTNGNGTLHKHVAMDSGYIYLF